MNKNLKYVLGLNSDILQIIDEKKTVFKQNKKQSFKNILNKHLVEKIKHYKYYYLVYFC